MTYRNERFSPAEIPADKRPRRLRCNCGPGPCPARMRIDAWYVPVRDQSRAKRWRDLRKNRAPDLRERLLKAFGQRCQYCGEYGDEHGVPNPPGGHVYHWTIDRIEPDGSYDPSNVTLACNSCNGRKGNRAPDFPVPSLAMMEAAA